MAPFNYDSGSLASFSDPQNFRQVSAILARPTDLLVGRSRMAKIARLDFNGNFLGEFSHPGNGYYLATHGLSYDNRRSGLVGLATAQPPVGSLVPYEIFVTDENGQYLWGTNLNTMLSPTNTFMIVTTKDYAVSATPQIYFAAWWSGRVYRVRYAPKFNIIRSSFRERLDDNFH